jgi:hypothetical protein
LYEAAHRHPSWVLRNRTVGYHHFIGQWLPVVAKLIPKRVFRQRGYQGNPIDPIADSRGGDGKIRA